MQTLKVFLHNFAFPVEMAAALAAYFLTSTLLEKTNKVSPRNRQAIAFMPAMAVLFLLSLVLQNPCFTGHTPAEAVCTEPVVCSVCGTELESAPGHDWMEATETAPKTCLRCGLTEGEPLSANNAGNGPTPSEADMVGCDERIELPEAWAEEYKTVFVDGEGDKRTMFYAAPDQDAERIGSLPDAVKLTVIAEENGFSLCKQYDECIGWGENKWLVEEYKNAQ